MNKKMRELQAQIAAKQEEVKGFMAEETKDLDAAEKALDEIDALQKEFDLEERAMKANKADAEKAAPAPAAEKVSGFKAMAGAIRGRVSDEEKALITGDDATYGENYLVPEDVDFAIRDLRKSYVSARDIVTVETTDSLKGAVTYEAGAPAGLTAFDDGDTITEETGVSFVRKSFAINWYGKLIPISRILLGSEKAGLMAYLNRWFVKNAVVTENAQIFGALKAGYNSGTPKAVAGWEALKASINVDLDPSALIDGVIVTNQSGFAALDAEKDENGRPILETNPAKATQKTFQGLPVKVFPDAQLPNISEGHFPMIYGSTKAGATLVEKSGLEFNVSEHFLFGKNQNCLRVIEGFDVMSTDASAYIYGSFTATQA